MLAKPSIRGSQCGLEQPFVSNTVCPTGLDQQLGVQRQLQILGVG